MTLLSVLDQSPIRSGCTAADAIRETLELAQACDRLGYHRYWLAEHHSTSALAGSCPEVLIGQVAAKTSRLRVGSGGVMLSHYSSLKVAESFRMLETLFPGRIDLGIGRAPGSDQLTARALAYGPGSLGLEYFPRRIADLVGFLQGQLEPDHPFGSVRAMPDADGMPEVWLLGSSADSAAYAAHFGTAFSFAHFINAEGGEEIMRAYQQHFQPSAWLPSPRGSLGVFVVCADTEEEAERLCRSRLLYIARIYTGQDGRYPTVAEADSHVWTPRERLIAEHARGRCIAGTPRQVRERLLQLGQAYDVDEFVVVTITEDLASRLRSYELLAAEFGLPGITPA
jgi:luciferase family oxidoreductase group 1